MTLQTKLLVGILPVVFLATASIGFFARHLSTQSLLDQIQQNTILMSEGFADELNTRIVKYERIVQGIAADVLMVINVEDALHAERTLFPEFQHLFYTSPTGNVISLVPHDNELFRQSFTEDPYWRRAVETGEVVMSSVHEDFGYPAISVIAPVLIHYAGGPPEVQGVVIAALPTEDLFEKVNRIRVGESGRILIADSDLRIINRGSPEDLDEKDLSAISPRHTLGRLMNAVQSKEIGWSVIRIDGESHYIAFSPIVVADSSLIITGEFEELTRDVEQLAGVMFGVLLIALGLATMIIFLSVKSVMRPVRKLTKVVSGVEDRGFDIEVKAARADEIGQLARAFNRMMGHIRVYRDDLERLVEERTERIRAINAQLRQEIEDRELAEKARGESEERYRALIEQSVEAIYLFDAQTGQIVEHNRAFREILGYSAEEASKLIVCDFANSTKEETKAFLNSVLTTGSAPLTECSWRTKSDGAVDVQLTGSKISQNGRELVFAVARDITEQKLLQSRLILADRLASLGTLAAGVAHEINNPLAFVISNLDYLKERLDRVDQEFGRELGDEDSYGELLHIIERTEDGTERVRRIVQDLRDFAHSGSDTPMDVNVLTVLESALSLASSEMRHHATITRDFNTVPFIFADVTRLGQVFLNLLVNALQALPPERGPEENEVIVRTYKGDEADVVVEIIDNGMGISKTDLDRIFDPFFTTKKVGVGIGLGLFICHNIVASLGGKIEVESEPGEGTTFRVRLPAAPAHEPVTEMAD
ncbi:MAG: ATP-binding protein [Bradymonadaceae bacterium]